MSDRQELTEACRRIMLTNDGRMLHLYLIRTLLDCEPPGVSDGALRLESGRRNFARELIRMFEDESGSAGTQRPEVRQAGSGQQPARVQRVRTSRRRFVRRDAAPGVGA